MKSKPGWAEDEFIPHTWEGHLGAHISNKLALEALVEILSTDSEQVLSYTWPEEIKKESSNL